MNAEYALRNPTPILSPALLFYKDLIRRNLAHMLKIAGSPQRLRPHVKTHKTREIVRMQLDVGITKHKCATIAEAEMLASCGVKDVLIAYPLVGPNCGRVARLAAAYPECRFGVTADDPGAARELSAALQVARVTVDMLLEVDPGQHRTGIEPGPAAVSLYQALVALPGFAPGGFHVYDGHQHQESAGEREAAIQKPLAAVLEIRAALERKGVPVPRLVLGGTPTFPMYAKLDLPGLECAPGTCVLHDHGYGSKFADLAEFQPAALLLTRVISRPRTGRLTLDLGYKAVAGDPPAGKRVLLLDLPDAVPVLHNEEHYVVETPAADQYPPGSVLYAVPTHICPTVALHKQALVVEQGRVTEQWDIVARDRVLSV